MLVDLDLISRSPVASGKDIYSTVILADPNNKTERYLCQIIKKIKPLDGSGKNSKILLFSSDETEYVAKVISDRRFSKYHKDRIFDVSNLQRAAINNPDIADCLLTDINQNDQYVGLDSFANEVIISFILSAILQDENLPSMTNIIDSFAICKNNAVIVSKRADLGNLYNFALREDNETSMFFEYYTGQYLPPNKTSVRILKSEVVLDILKQIIITLDVLKSKVNFMSGDFKLENILLDLEDTNFRKDGVGVNSKLRIRLIDFGSASVTIASNYDPNLNNIRIFNEIRVAKYMGAKLIDYSAETEIRQRCYPSPNAVLVRIGEIESLCDNSTWWKLPSTFDAIFSLLTMHSGISFYKAYDFYTFMVSMMLVPQYYYAVASDPRLSSLWLSLWLQEDMPLLVKRIKFYHGERPSLKKSVDVLRGLHMRCNAIQHAKELIATIEETTGLDVRF